MAISTVVDHALQMDMDSLARHDIAVLREYTDVPVMMGDKHKVLQILINLVNNAKHALNGAPNPDKRLTVSIRLNADNHVEVTVADNGVGIPPENLTRIFSYGFTTRRQGHGFGLHSGANAAKQMGGRLTASSGGAGKGAAFTLMLPLVLQQADL
jgi:signal transduction histidine kinase